MDHQRFVFDVIKGFQARCRDGNNGLTFVIHDQHGQIAQVAFAIRSGMFTGFVGIIVSASRLSRRGFAVFNGGLATAVGVNVEAMLARR